MTNRKGSTALAAVDVPLNSPAIKQLRETIDQAIRFRDTKADEVARYLKSLKGAEDRVADYDRDIESYRAAIRALGGEA